MKRLFALSAVLVILFQLHVSAAVFDATQYTREELQSIFCMIQSELSTDVGELVYEGDDYSVIWNGFHHRSDDWFVPIFIFKNTSGMNTWVSINDYYINECLIGYSNAGNLSLLDNGMATAASDSLWSMDKADITMYGISSIDSITISVNILDADSYKAKVLKTITVTAYPNESLDSI